MRMGPLSTKMVLMPHEKVINPSWTELFTQMGCLKHRCRILEQVTMIKGKITKRELHAPLNEDFLLGLGNFLLSCIELINTVVARIEQTSESTFWNAVLLT